MNIIDAIVVLLFISALIRGVEKGLVRQILATVGLLAGFLAGSFIQGKLIHLADSPNQKALLSVFIILAAVVAGISLGEMIGSRVKARINEIRFKPVDIGDKILGSGVAGITILLVVWLSASILSNVPGQGFQRQIQNSYLIAQLNNSLPAAPDVVARLGHLIDPNGFPDVFMGLEPRIDLDVPLPSIGDLDAAVNQVRASVVKVQGEGCGGVATGSGFVADDGFVITNAHVVAGVKNPYIIDANGEHKARVLWFDPGLDMAVLEADDLAGAPLTITTAPVTNGTPAAAIGYPGGGNFTAAPATVIDSFNATGRDIYNQHRVAREVYSLKATIEPGNSGGPLVNQAGEVVGLIFAESTTYDNVGYALTMTKVLEGFNQAKDQMQTRTTDNCAS